MKSLEAQIAELNESGKTKDVEIARLQGVVASADKTVAGAKLAEMCKEAGLGKTATTKLAEAFKEAVNVNGMQEAVNTEKKYAEEILKESGKDPKIVRNNGAQAGTVQESETKLATLKEEQKKAYLASGFSEADAKGMAGIA